jgi:hypothetical protein
MRYALDTKIHVWMLETLQSISQYNILLLADARIST